MGGQTWRNVKITEEPLQTTVRYHNTDILTFNSDEIIIRTGGWKTPSTKDKINLAAGKYGLGFYIRQKNFEWYVVIRNNEYIMKDDIFIINR